MVAPARCVCLLATMLSAQASIPFDLHREFVITARGSVGTLHDLTFVIDTGTSTSLLDERVARALALTGEPSALASFSAGRGVEDIEVPSVRLGPIRKTRMRMLVADLAGLKRAFGSAPDVIVGADFVRGERLAIDYGARRLYFDRKESMTAGAPLDASSRQFIVRAIIDDVPLRLVVDTGSEVIALFEQRSPASWRWRAGSPIRAEDFTGAVALRPMIAATLSVGNSTWHDHTVYLIAGAGPGSYDGVLGIRALEVSSAAFDLIDLRLSWRH